MQIIESLRQRFSARAAQQAATFSSLVASLAADRDVDPDEAFAILDAAGKAPADLEHAVAAERRKLTLLAEAEKLDELTALAKAADSKHDAALERRRELIESENAKVKKLADAVADAHRAVDAASRAKAELERLASLDADDSDLTTELSDLRAHFSAVPRDKRPAVQQRIASVSAELQSRREKRVAEFVAK